MPAPERRRHHAALLAAALAALLALACVPPAHAAPPPLDEAGYWRVADRLQTVIEPHWDPQQGIYTAGGSITAINGQMLATHALAALHGHEGPARQDARARSITRALTASPPFAWTLRPGLSYAPTWTTSLDAWSAIQHPVFDTQVVDGLVAAWRARDALGLSPELVGQIGREIAATSTGPYYRWPAVRLNQFNWNADLLAAAAVVAGRGRALRRDLARYIRGFAARVDPAPGWAGNLGPGLRFHYNPRTPLNDPHNVDSAEYANTVWTFAPAYLMARRTGMPRPAGADLSLLREWARRVVSGYWTHGGYLNWDTGFGFMRWHQAKKLGLAQEALVGLAAVPELEPSRHYAWWSKWILDRSLGLYVRWLDERGGELPPPLAFGVDAVPQRPCDAVLAATRVQANAARAADLGLGALPSARPPALYAFDPDIGRLAVTTPGYNTAIVAVNQRAFPYGGLDLARLFDGDQQVAGGIGGRPPASFGLVVRDASGHRLLATQTGRPRVREGVTPLRLLQAPRGAGATASARPRRASAGPFRTLRATGSVRSGRLLARVSHRFTPEWIESSWSLRQSALRPVSADVLFPSWGPSATVTMVSADGSRSRLDRRRRALPAGASLEIHSERSGYVVVPRGATGELTVRLLHPEPQTSAPRPGPTLAIGLAHKAAIRQVALGVRLHVVPAGSGS